MSDKTRPSGRTKSYHLVWDKNNPVVKESHWQPDYTPAHKATVEEAVQEGMKDLTREIADTREKWLKINILLAELIQNNIDNSEDSPAEEQSKDAWPGVVKSWPIVGDE